MFKYLIFIISFQLSAQVNYKNWQARDAFDFDYYITNNILIKEKTTEKWEYNNISLGKISSLDVLNSFQNVLFYKEFHTVVLLDNFLNEIKKIDFFNSHQLMLDFVATAAGNRLWLKEKGINVFYLYDLKNNQLVSINRIFDQSINHFFSDFNHLYYIDNTNSVYQISVFGNINKIADLNKEVENFVVYQEKIFYNNENQIIEYQWNKKSENVIFDSKNKIDKICIHANKIIIFANNLLEEIQLK